MARALSTQVKEFLDMWLSPSRETLLTQVPTYTFTILKYPYEHNVLNRRKYEYTIKDGFELMKSPWEIDLMENFETSNRMKAVLKRLTIPPDYNGLNRYKQIVVHRQTYTGVFHMECGTEEKVIQITIE